MRVLRAFYGFMDQKSLSIIKYVVEERDNRILESQCKKWETYEMVYKMTTKDKIQGTHET